MRIVLFVLGGLVALILLVLVVGMIVPGDFNVERTLNMSAPPAAILPYVADLRQWPSWTDWNPETIPELKSTFTDADPTAGTLPTWEWQDPSMQGLITVTRSDDTGIEYDLTFKGFPPAEGSLTLSAVGEKTDVTWHMSGSVGSNPISRLLAYFISMDDALGAQLDSALVTLKGKVEG